MAYEVEHFPPISVDKEVLSSKYGRIRRWLDTRRELGLFQASQGSPANHKQRMESMKKLGFLSLAIVLMSGVVAISPASAAPAYDASQFTGWVQSDGLWRTVVSTSFKDGSQYAPTDEKLKAIMKFASLTPTSTGKTDYLLVVLKDPAQQVDVVGKGQANSGTVTVLVFGDRILPTKVSADSHTQQVDRGYYNVGIASGYLNLAAISFGYGTHFYMTPQYAIKGARTQEIEDVYLKDKGYKYTFGFDASKQGDAKGQANAYGNLKFVCAIVIGTLDEKAQTTVTDHGYPENWVIAK
jgi:nitroreductase